MLKSRRTPLLHTSNLITALFFATAWVLALFIYSQGWSGGWHFDDPANLSALSDIFDEGRLSVSAAVQFVLSGDAGPLGRPIALLSFLVDGSSWSYGPKAMLYTNTLLHILNGVFLFSVFMYVGRIRKQSEQHTLWVALFASFIWLVSPILVSSSLMVVQRMTVLSSTFMLLGVLGYLLGRTCLVKSPVRSMLVMLASIGLGTLLGILTKEQAVMLPSLVWILEVCLLPKPQLSKTNKKLWNAFKWLAFYLPTALIIAYLLRYLVRSGGVYTGREFDVAERLWTQSVILWDYVRLTFLPRALAFGPFHDDYPILQASVLTVVSTLSWVALFITSWLVRHKTKLPLFAILWFLAAHLVESSVVGLELYFEHRNYIAIAGPIYALIAGVYLLAQSNGKIKYASYGVTVYVGLLLFVLYQTTSLFGQPALAAEMWYLEHPHSARATQFLAGELTKKSDISTALHVLDKAAEEQEKPAAIRLQGLQLACVLNESTEQLQVRYEQLLQELPIAPKRFSITDTLNKLDILHSSESCHGFLTMQRLVELAKASLENPIITGPAQEKTNIHIYLALLYMSERDLGSTMFHIEKALKATPTVPVLGFAVGVLHSAGLYPEALELLEEYPPALPKNIVLKKQVEAEWGELQKLVQSKL